ncbi:MAG: hypothetical protein HYU59_16350 [Magnetospirillum gryphiswaldense]|nr:hypothetical protein [Magnetospirillum gryphiswaldense]
MIGRSVLLVVMLAGPAAAEDLHALWDGQCGACHGHAGDFARSSLEIRNDQLVGKASGRPVAEYLVVHNGGYSVPQIVALRTMLTAQVQTTPEFQTHCGGCHDSAAQVLRDWVVMRDGRLFGRQSGQDLEQFLIRHGGADADSRGRIIQSLTRVADELNHR